MNKVNVEYSCGRSKEHSSRIQEKFELKDKTAKREKGFENQELSAKYECDQVILKGKHPLFCAKHPS